MKKLLGVLLLVGITFLINMENGEVIGFDNDGDKPLMIQCYPSKDKAIIIWFDKPPTTIAYYLLRWRGEVLGWFKDPGYVYKPLQELPKLIY